MDNLSHINITFRQQDTENNSPTEIGQISYKFQCNGGVTPTVAPLSKERIIVENYIDELFISRGFGSDLSNAYSNINTVNSDYAQIKFTKMFSAPGQDATYIFNIRPKPYNKTSEEIRFAAGSHIYIEFARQISPLLNKYGKIQCYQEDHPIYCNFINERRIEIFTSNDLDHRIAYGHNFSVIGVTQPSDLERFPQMFLAIAPFETDFSGIIYQNNFTLIDYNPKAYHITPLLVHWYEQGADNIIRSTFNILIHIVLPANQVKNTIPLWIDFPEEFIDSMYLGFTPICSLKNFLIENNDNYTEFVSSCYMNSTRRLKIQLFTDELNTIERKYILSISNLPAPTYLQTQWNFPLIWQGNETHSHQALYRTNIGNFNASYNQKAFTHKDQSLEIFTWESNPIQCYISSYRCSASLILESGKNFPEDILEIIPEGNFSDYFSTNPKQLTLYTGNNSVQFELAPKNRIIPGFYQLNFSQNVTKTYTPIPPLSIIALNDRTLIEPESNQYEIPQGSYSLPIIFDFTDKQPETNITIEGLIYTLNSNLEYSISKYISFKGKNNKTLNFYPEKNETQIHFIVKDHNTTNGLANTYIEWKLGGIDGERYKIGQKTFLVLEESNNEIPVAAISGVDPYQNIGEQTINAQCTQPGAFYYSISADKNTSLSVSYETIKEKTEENNIRLTSIGNKTENYNRTFYGYQSIFVANSTQSILIDKNLESGYTYYIQIYCASKQQIVSSPVNTSWTQSSNGGYPIILTFQFYKETGALNKTYVSLTTKQKKELTCLISKIARHEKNLVYSSEGQSCAEYEANNNELGYIQVQTKRFLQNTENSTTDSVISEPIDETFLLLPQTSLSKGNLDDQYNNLAGINFKTEIANSATQFSDLQIESVSLNKNQGAFPSLPEIKLNQIQVNDNSLRFQFNCSNYVNGFIYIGLLDQFTQNEIPPIQQELLSKSNYKFSTHNISLFKGNQQNNITMNNLTSCNYYKYFWMAGNEDKTNFQCLTNVTSGFSQTQCPLKAFLNQYSHIIFLLSCFLFIILY